MSPSSVTGSSATPGPGTRDHAVRYVWWTFATASRSGVGVTRDGVDSSYGEDSAVLSRSASARAAGRSAPCATTTNSSPPKRLTVSSGRTCACRRTATASRTSSPTV